MKILFLHGWHSVPGGVKPTYLAEHGHDVLNPALDDDDFAAALRTAQEVYDRERPDVIVGSSRGGAVALNIDSDNTPLVLLCPAWKNWGTARTLKPGSVILHSRHDDVIPFDDSAELVSQSGLPPETLIEVGTDHRLADPEPLAQMLAACEAAAAQTPVELVDVTVYYLEMRSPSAHTVPAPRDGLSVRHVPAPEVAFYRSLYNAVGRDYYWLSRRKLSDEALAAILQDPRTELHVLQVDGVAAGMVELDLRQPQEIEIVQFGLRPEFIGQGLGKWFLQWTIDSAWSRQPERLWLHTCTLDHPAALPLYQQAGFVLYRQEDIRREL